MANCPNKNLEEWKLLVAARGEDVAYYLWDKYSGSVPESESKLEIVKAGLKATNILQSAKADQFFGAVAKNKITGDFFWKKMQADLGIPKDQLEILKSFNTQDRGELISSLLANYSFAIEINVGKQTIGQLGSRREGLQFTIGDSSYSSFRHAYKDEFVFTKNTKTITKDEYDAARDTFQKNYDSTALTKNTDYYSNLTVPGGTNYTENEIATPAITPSIKGHAQFATDQGIGWFRSDEESKTEETRVGTAFDKGYLTEEEKEQYFDGGNTQEDLDEALKNHKGNETRKATIGGSKTRRILELQSDLFQKGRDKENLDKDRIERIQPDPLFPSADSGNILPNTTSNQFLQLLNQGSNWVTFFVKSIVQDSSKKGYEKVLFPSGDTASKVEGHTTLEQFKKQKEDRLKELEDKVNKGRYVLTDSTGFPMGIAPIDSDINVLKSNNPTLKIEKESLTQKELDDTNNEINQLKQELERVEGPEGFGALKPIYNFYENTVKNVLNKQYGKENVKQVTDEYGNTWNEVEIVPEREQQPIFLQKPTGTEQKASPKLISLMKEFVKSIGVDYKLVSDVVVDGVKQDANGVALIMQKLVQVVEGQEDVALPEEAMHFAVEIIRQTNPKLYQQLLKEINGHPKLNAVIALYGNDPAYQKDGKRDIVKLKEEAIAQVLANRLEDVVGRTWFQKIIDFLTPRFMKAGFDKASMDVLSGKIASVEDIDVSQRGAYFQLSTGERVFNDLLETSKRIETKDGGYELDGIKSVRRVSDFAKEFYERIFPPSAKSEFEDAVNSLKAEKGTAGHTDIEYALKMLIDPTTGLLREEMEDDSDYISKLNPNDRRMYEILRDNLRERLLAIDEKAPGTRFMSEVKIFDKKRKIAGTVDFIAVTPDGKTSILDWKFMDLNTDRYEDVPWYKVEAWRIQMGKYKDIISTNYGVKSQDFDQTRMIPILAKYTKADFEKEILPRLLEVKIGSANIQNIEEDYLLPVGLADEKTGNKKIDKLIEQFNATYRKLAEEKVNDSERGSKAEQLNALYKAIRHLQIKGNVVPLINQAKILNKQVSMLLKRYNTDFEGKDPSEVDADKINAFAGMIRVHLEALQPYLNLKQLGTLLTDETEENDKLKLELGATRDKVEDYIFQLEELDETFGEKFNNTSSTPEKVVKGITKWFSSISTIQVANIQTLYKLANKAFGLSNIETLEQVKRLNVLKDEYTKWASSKGLSIGNYFNILMKKDKNELIDQYDKKFYDELKSRIAKKDVDWILDNVNKDLYREHLEELTEKEIQYILSRPRVGTEEEVKASIKRDMAKIYAKYDIQNKNSNGWLMYKEVRQFPKTDKWESEEWKELNKPENAPAKKFYDYIVERNKYFQSVEYLNGKAARKFLPWIRKGFTEGLVFEGKSRGLGEQFLRNISMDENEAGYGQTDPITGELINSVPKYFTKDLGEGYSTDLFKTMALYNEYAIKFKNLKDIEERSLQLLRIERNKKSIMTSTFGSLLKEGDDLKYNPNNLENSKLLEDMIKSVVYQQKYIQSEVFDVALGKISGFGKTLNEKLGITLFPENLEERQLSANKFLDTINTQFQITTLGLNPLSAISNLFGGTANGLINAGKYFTKLDFLKTQMWMLGGKMTGGEDRQKALAALDYFVPFVESYNKNAARKLSLNKIDEQAVQDYLMFLMRNGDEGVQALNFYTFIKNTIVQDGKIVNVREYLRSTDEYKAFYSGTQQERKERADKFEKDVQELLDDKGVLKLGEVIDGEFVIPGVDKKSDSVIEFRRIVQSFTTDALGSMSEENKRLVNMNVYASSMMVFKNWIPRLVDVRIGNIKYNAASDAYEWGRMRMIFGMVFTDTLKSINSLQSALGGNNDVWLEQVRGLYERKQSEYEANTGKKLDMTEDEFIALVNQNIKNQAVDLIILLGLISLLAGLKAAAPDDDEDALVRNQYKFLLKATDKLTDELMYFYKPTTPLDLISGKGGIFPSIGLLDNYKKFFTNFVSENYGIITDNEEIQDDATPIKYLMKSFPIASQASGYLPMFYPSLAKDLGIKMQSQYGIR
jgi:hypothetical protein